MMAKAEAEAAACNRGGKARLAVRQKVFFDVVAVGLEQHIGSAQLADLLLGAFDHAVALARMRVEHLSGPRHLEALFSARLGLDLGHLALPIMRDPLRTFPGNRGRYRDRRRSR